MTIEQLHATYTAKQLSHNPGNANFRRKAFAPLLQNLFENCVVYHEGPIYAVAQVSALAIDRRGFSAMSEIRHRILLSSRDYIVWPARPWRFSTTWARLALVGNALSAPNCPFTIWPDPPLVKEVQRLAVLGQKAEIRSLLYPEEV